MHKLRITFATVGVLVATLALSACTAPSADQTGAGVGASSTSKAAEFNDQDVAFASLMIAHHEQAVKMAGLVLGKSGIDTRVTELAGAIKSAQGPENVQMKSLLQAWGTPYVAMPGMDMGGEGMMSDAELSELTSATGAVASKLFLTQMIAHHTGALSMATTEVSGGANADAVALAQSIVESQTAEIATMKTILASL